MKEQAVDTLLDLCHYSPTHPSTIPLRKRYPQHSGMVGRTMCYGNCSINYIINMIVTMINMINMIVTMIIHSVFFIVMICEEDIKKMPPFMYD